MLVTTKLKRIFLYKEKEHEIRLADPSPSFSPEAVLNFYTQTYPILITAKIEGPKFGEDELQFRFVTTIGTKG